MYNNIVSFAPSNTELLFELGLGSNVVAVTRFCDHPKEALELPKISGFTDLILEKCLNSSPT